MLKLWISKRSYKKKHFDLNMSSSPTDLSAAAIKLAIETTANALIVEQENAKLHDQLQKNLQLLGDFEIDAPRAKLLQKQLK